MKENERIFVDVTCYIRLYVCPSRFKKSLKQDLLDAYFKYLFNVDGTYELNCFEEKGSMFICFYYKNVESEMPVQDTYLFIHSLKKKGFLVSYHLFGDDEQLCEVVGLNE